MAAIDELSAVQINQIERRIADAEKVRGPVTLEPRMVRQLIELAKAQMESQKKPTGW